MNLRALFLFHSIVTFLASIVLVVKPTFIPETINVSITRDGYILCYFLAAAELGVAYLSFYSRRIKDNYSLRIISTSFIIFHASTGLLEIYAFTQGISSRIVPNIILRVIIVILFYYYGIFKNRESPFVNDPRKSGI